MKRDNPTNFFCIISGETKSLIRQSKSCYFWVLLRVRPRFFDQVGYETMYASSGNKHFFTKSSDSPQISNRANKNWAQF